MCLRVAKRSFLRGAKRSFLRGAKRTPDLFLNTLLHTKDSAPGPDGLPYSAWRLLPKVTVEAMKSCFFDIINGTALPPHQVGVWIPKAKIGPEADCFRPLGMPNTLERLVDGSVAAHAMRQTAHTSYYYIS